MRVQDPTIAERSRRYRKRRRATLRSPRGATVGSPPAATVRSPLSARQEAAIEALLDTIEAHGERPGPDGEPIVPASTYFMAGRGIVPPADHTFRNQMVGSTCNAAASGPRRPETAGTGRGGRIQQVR